MLLTLLAVLFLLLLSAFFSASETALTAASKPLMHQMEQEGDRRASFVNRLHEAKDRMLGTILLGNNLVNILASALTTSLLISLYGEAGVAYATVGLTVVVLIFGEIMPKTYAINNANKLALIVALPLRILSVVLAPVVVVIEVIVRATMRLFGGKQAAKMSLTEALAELRGAIELHTTEEVKHERAMLRSILDLDEVEVAEIMTHRRNMVTIDASQPASAIVDQVLASPFTRLPLWQGEQDNVVGILHAKALLRAVRAHPGDLDELDVVSLASPPWFIPDSTSLFDQLQAFRDRREHFAIVVDEYGALLGIVTLEDILEEIVGEISDEHDIAVLGVRPQTDGSYVVDGNVTIRDLNREFDWRLPDEEASTIAGLVLHESRLIPEVGQSFMFHGFRFDVVRRHRNQLTAIRITPPPRDSLEDKA
ncbi:HlyC/CorC family transporter [Telmatospirillum sp. J64-1]|uniref:HlyC/CorC family transporter n=1 Tax=Telmatospirillum sp. J64-1 TaxID=2502183 RepID=UPI00115C7F98|nr:HlyC/CorC family transporter [Telmatospirillum sp. J64-1]